MSALTIALAGIAGGLGGFLGVKLALLADRRNAHARNRAALARIVSDAEFDKLMREFDRAIAYYDDIAINGIRSRDGSAN